MEHVGVAFALGKESTQGVYAVMDSAYVMPFVCQVAADTAEAAVERFKQYQDSTGGTYSKPFAVPIAIMRMVN